LLRISIKNQVQFKGQSTDYLNLIQNY